MQTIFRFGVCPSSAF